MLMISSLWGVISVDVIASATSVLVFLCTSSSDGERGSPVQDLQRYPGGGSGVLANIVPCMGMLGSFGVEHALCGSAAAGSSKWW